MLGLQIMDKHLSQETLEDRPSFALRCKTEPNAEVDLALTQFLKKNLSFLTLDEMRTVFEGFSRNAEDKINELVHSLIG